MPFITCFTGGSKPRKVRSHAHIMARECTLTTHVVISPRLNGSCVPKYHNIIKHEKHCHCHHGRVTRLIDLGPNVVEQK